MNKGRVFSTILAVFFAQGALAMRCHDVTITPGESQQQVMAHCGEPKMKTMQTESEVVYDPLGLPMGELPNAYERWIYPQASSDMAYELTFENGKVKSITAKEKSR